MYVKKDYVWNPAKCSCKNGQYLASIMKDSTIMCDEVIESYNEGVEAKSYDETKTVSTGFNEKNTTCRTQNFYILLAFLLIAIALMIAISIIVI